MVYRWFPSHERWGGGYIGGVRPFKYGECGLGGFRPMKDGEGGLGGFRPMKDGGVWSRWGN